MNQSITKMYEDLPKIAKILIQIFLGAVVSGLYRVLRQGVRQHHIRQIRAVSKGTGFDSGHRIRNDNAFQCLIAPECVLADDLQTLRQDHMADTGPTVS